VRCLLLYDIPDDRIRTKVADICLDYGLDRIQYSAFVGRLSANHQEELMLKIQQRIGTAPAKVHLIPVCKQDWARRLVFEQEREGNEKPRKG